MEHASIQNCDLAKERACEAFCALGTSSTEGISTTRSSKFYVICKNDKPVIRSNGCVPNECKMPLENGSIDDVSISGELCKYDKEKMSGACEFVGKENVVFENGHNKQKVHCGVDQTANMTLRIIKPKCSYEIKAPSKYIRKKGIEKVSEGCLIAVHNDKIYVVGPSNCRVTTAMGFYLKTESKTTDKNKEKELICPEPSSVPQGSKLVISLDINSCSPPNLIDGWYICHFPETEFCTPQCNKGLVPSRTKYYCDEDPSLGDITCGQNECEFPAVLNMKGEPILGLEIQNWVNTSKCNNPKGKNDRFTESCDILAQKNVGIDGENKWKKLTCTTKGPLPKSITVQHICKKPEIKHGELDDNYCMNGKCKFVCHDGYQKDNQPEGIIDCDYDDTDKKVAVCVKMNQNQQARRLRKRSPRASKTSVTQENSPAPEEVTEDAKDTKKPKLSTEALIVIIVVVSIIILLIIVCIIWKLYKRNCRATYTPLPENIESDKAIQNNIDDGSSVFDIGNIQRNESAAIPISRPKSETAVNTHSKRRSLGYDSLFY